MPRGCPSTPPQDGLTYLVNAPTPVTAQIACVNAKGGQMSQFYTYSYMQYFLNPRVSVPLMLKPEMGGWVGGWVVFFSVPAASARVLSLAAACFGACFAGGCRCVNPDVAWLGVAWMFFSSRMHRFTSVARMGCM